MTHEEALEQIWTMWQDNSRLAGVVSDLFYIIKHPDRFKGSMYRIAKAHAGENTVWSIKNFAEWMRKLAGENGLLGGGYKDVYVYTGDWNVCDDCGEITLCSHQMATLECNCIYCRAKKFVERCCDTFEYLDGELMRNYLQTGKIDPLLKWIPDHTWDSIKTELYRPSPVLPAKPTITMPNLNASIKGPYIPLKRYKNLNTLEMRDQSDEDL